MAIEVYLDDVACSDFAAADTWAREHCASYTGVSVHITHGLDLRGDELAVYRFDSSADAAWFTLQWQR